MVQKKRYTTGKREALNINKWTSPDESLEASKLRHKKRGEAKAKPSEGSISQRITEAKVENK
jgi:hypothetical protein